MAKRSYLHVFPIASLHRPNVHGDANGSLHRFAVKLKAMTTGLPVRPARPSDAPRAAPHPRPCSARHLRPPPCCAARQHAFI